MIITNILLGCAVAYLLQRNRVMKHKIAFYRVALDISAGECQRRIDSLHEDALHHGAAAWRVTHPGSPETELVWTDTGSKLPR